MQSRSRSFRRRMAGGLAALALAAGGLAGPAAPARAVSLSAVAYVIDHGTPQTLDEVDVATNTIIMAMTMQYDTEQVVASPDDSVVYVSSLGADSVSVIDPVTPKVQHTIPVCPESDPHAMAVTPDSSQLWVTCADGTIDVIDAASATVTRTITAPGVVQQVLFSRDGSTAYGDVLLNEATIDATTEVAVIPTGTDTIAATVSVPGAAAGMALNPDGSALFLSVPMTVGVSVNATVDVIDTASRTLTSQIATTSMQSPVTAVNPAGTAFYICEKGTLDIVDLVDRELTTVLKSPCGYGVSMALTPDGNELYSPYGYGVMNVINAFTGQLVTTISSFSGEGLAGIAMGRLAVRPMLWGISPRQGSETGGTAVTISGSGLTSTTAVLFGGVPAPSFTVDSDDLLTAVSPPHVEGPADITVYTQNGAATYTAGFTYTEIPPTVTGLSPADGVSRGGTTVTITGTDFNTAGGVYFGGTAASWFTVDSDTQITAVTRAQTDGTVDVTVTNAAGTSPAVAADEFTFFPPIPAITAVSPPSGTMDGGKTVTITGAWFTNASRVTFGDTPAASFHVDSSTQITAVTPYHDAGPVDVRVTTDVDTSPVAASDQYTFLQGP